MNEITIIKNWCDWFSQKLDRSAIDSNEKISGEENTLYEMLSEVVYNNNSVNWLPLINAINMLKSIPPILEDTAEVDARVKVAHNFLRTFYKSLPCGTSNSPSRHLTYAVSLLADALALTVTSRLTADMIETHVVLLNNLQSIKITNDELRKIRRELIKATFSIATRG